MENPAFILDKAELLSNCQYIECHVCGKFEFTLVFIRNPQFSNAALGASWDPYALIGANPELILQFKNHLRQGKRSKVGVNGK